MSTCRRHECCVSSCRRPFCAALSIFSSASDQVVEESQVRILKSINLNSSCRCQHPEGVVYWRSDYFWAWNRSRKPCSGDGVAGFRDDGSSFHGPAFLGCQFYAIFDNYLLQTLARTAPQIDSAEILYIGVSGLTNVHKEEQLALIRDAYMVGIKAAFAFALAGIALTIVLALLIPFATLPSHETKKAEDKEAAAKTPWIIMQGT
ncbi:uncharacterized protein N7483_007573 [Penicillium malachiteum]|uniref:uncharacterized protein n=1 Tax=Penicillium malachiteum TaxID=1324776 RepID=UPI002548A4A5|nr:uncharacterized protein N7483_007573 [Penicillium malachiteum]KAJ5726216.1 hypothetical protein N7483_007573 [Penicillium malachiteum]